MTAYETPHITELGSIADFTRGEGFRGSHDSLTFWGITIIEWGQPPTS
jgi:hypothetical protein